MADAFVLDKQSILERLGGDEDIFAMMVDMFLQDVDNNCAALDGAMQSGDTEAIRREVHTVKGLLATFSDESGAAEAQRIENQARIGDTANLDAAINGLKQRLRDVARVLSGA